MEVCKRKHHFIRGDCGQLIKSTWQLPPCMSTTHRSAKKIHQSITVSTSLNWKTYRPHKSRSQPKLTKTLTKPSPLTPPQLLNPFPKSRWMQKVNPSSLQIRSQQIYGKKQHLLCYRVICRSRRKKERRAGRFGSLCAVLHQIISQWYYGEYLGNAKCKGCPRKRENIKNAGVRKNKID